MLLRSAAFAAVTVPVWAMCVCSDPNLPVATTDPAAALDDVVGPAGVPVGSAVTWTLLAAAFCFAAPAAVLYHRSCERVRRRIARREARKRFRRWTLPGSRGKLHRLCRRTAVNWPKHSKPARFMPRRSRSNSAATVSMR